VAALLVAICDALHAEPQSRLGVRNAQTSVSTWPGCSQSWQKQACVCRAMPYPVR
jgi:hypothetical protein